MLLEMLSSHPHVFAEREIFIELDGRSVDDMQGRIYGSAPRSIHAVGFKVFYFHPVDDQSGSIWNRLNDIAELRIVHVKRKNLLRMLTSFAIAVKTGAFYGTSQNATPLSDRQVQFAADVLERKLRQQRHWETTFPQRFTSRRIIDVYYEDLVTDPEGEFRRVTDFLDLDPAPFRTTLKRQNPESLADLITNYHELREHFKETEWAPFFDD